MSQSMSDILFDELNAACHRYGVNASQEEGGEGGRGAKVTITIQRIPGRRC